MGIFLSVSNSSKELSHTQKLYNFTDNTNNEIIIDPNDFPTFIKKFRGIQWKKEDYQIKLHNIVLEWKSKLNFDEETQDIRNIAYELIETIESQHDEQDSMLECENQKLDILVREDSLMNSRTSHNNNSNSSLLEEYEFNDVKKEISLRQQYLRNFNTQSTNTLKLALVDIESCQQMVDRSKDFKEMESESEEDNNEEQQV